MPKHFEKLIALSKKYGKFRYRKIHNIAQKELISGSEEKRKKDEIIVTDSEDDADENDPTILRATQKIPVIDE
jgi:hypothetical protein